MKTYVLEVTVTISVSASSEEEASKAVAEMLKFKKALKGSYRWTDPVIANLEQDEPKNIPGFCKTCRRDTNAPLFDGCINADCPHGYKPCL